MTPWLRAQPKDQALLLQILATIQTPIPKFLSQQDKKSSSSSVSSSSSCRLHVLRPSVLTKLCILQDRLAVQVVLPFQCFLLLRGIKISTLPPSLLLPESWFLPNSFSGLRHHSQTLEISIWEFWRQEVCGKSFKNLFWKVCGLTEGEVKIEEWCLTVRGIKFEERRKEV